MDQRGGPDLRLRLHVHDCVQIVQRRPCHVYIERVRIARTNFTVSALATSESIGAGTALGDGFPQERKQRDEYCDERHYLEAPLISETVLDFIFLQPGLPNGFVDLRVLVGLQYESILN
jgi:hypothetical protein